MIFKENAITPLYIDLRSFRKQLGRHQKENWIAAELGRVVMWALVNGGFCSSEFVAQISFGAPPHSIIQTLCPGKHFWITVDEIDAIFCKREPIISYSTEETYYLGMDAITRLYYLWNALAPLHNLGHHFFLAGRSSTFLSIGSGLFKAKGISSPEKEKIDWVHLSPLSLETIQAMIHVEKALASWTQTDLAKRVLSLTGGVPRLVVFALTYLVGHINEPNWERGFLRHMLNSANSNELEHVRQYRKFDPLLKVATIFFLHLTFYPQKLYVHAAELAVAQVPLSTQNPIRLKLLGLQKTDQAVAQALLRSSPEITPSDQQVEFLELDVQTLIRLLCLYTETIDKVYDLICSALFILLFRQASASIFQKLSLQPWKKIRT